jgi:hypothetical protein
MDSITSDNVISNVGGRGFRNNSSSTNSNTILDSLLEEEL